MTISAIDESQRKAARVAGFTFLFVVSLPLQITGFIKGASFIWIPALVFEVTLGLWLLIKGVAAQTTAT